MGDKQPKTADELPGTEIIERSQRGFWIWRRTVERRGKVAAVTSETRAVIEWDNGTREVRPAESLLTAPWEP